MIKPIEQLRDRIIQLRRRTLIANQCDARKFEKRAKQLEFHYLRLCTMQEIMKLKKL